MTGGPRLSASRGGGADTLSGAAALAGWASFLAWAKWVAAALFFNFEFSYQWLQEVDQVVSPPGGAGQQL
jgi:preprotein translocase subunit SecG